MVNILQNHTKLDWPDRCPPLGPYRYRSQSEILFNLVLTSNCVSISLFSKVFKKEIF